MSNLHNTTTSFPSEYIQASIGDYLDHLCAPLLGIVPYEQRMRLRSEAEDHLLLLVEDFEGEGSTPAEAVAKALREYGEPYPVGQSWAESWVSGSERGTCRLSLADPLTMQAFGWFGIFTVANLLLIERQAFLIRHDDLFPLSQCLWALSPIVAGAAAGANFHPRMGTSICRAVLPLIVISLGVGIQLLPQWEGIQFVLFQCAFWLPVGYFAATVTANLRRQLRIRSFRPRSC